MESASQPVLIITPSADANRLALRIDEQLHQEAREYVRLGRQGAPNSVRAYNTDLKQYQAWCSENQYPLLPLTPVALVEYVTYLGRQRSFYTVQRHLASLAKYHRLNELGSPTTNEQFKVL